MDLPFLWLCKKESPNQFLFIDLGSLVVVLFITLLAKFNHVKLRTCNVYEKSPNKQLIYLLNQTPTDTQVSDTSDAGAFISADTFIVFKERTNLY